MEEEKIPSLLQSAICFCGIFLTVAVGFLVFDISVHILLITSIIWASLHSSFLGYDFKTIKDAMMSGIEKGLGAIFIFVLIGAVIASFIESGTIASLVYYSLDLIHPAAFLPAAFVLCSLMSSVVGTAWGTVGTAGIILIGIGDAMGIPLPIVAGAVISGASFGDKMSPLSDTTNLAAACAGTDLYTHIRSMMFTTIPTYLICLVLYSFVGLQYLGGTVPLENITAFKLGLEDIFVISPLAFAPIFVMFMLSTRKVPPEPAMIASIIVAVIIAIIQQDRSLVSVLYSLQNGYSISSGQENIDTLLNRGGIQSMMWTLSLSLFALTLGGVLHRFRYLEILLQGIMRLVKRTASLVAVTIGAGFLGNISMGEGYLSIIMSSQLFAKKYQEQGLEKHMLSRCVEEGSTLTVALIPWSTAGAFYFGALGIPVMSYAPWAFLNYLNPLLSIILAYLGYGIWRIAQESKKADDSDLLSVN